MKKSDYFQEEHHKNCMFFPIICPKCNMSVFKKDTSSHVCSIVPPTWIHQFYPIEIILRGRESIPYSHPLLYHWFLFVRCFEKRANRMLCCRVCPKPYLEQINRHPSAGARVAYGPTNPPKDIETLRDFLNRELVVCFREEEKTEEDYAFGTAEIPTPADSPIINESSVLPRTYEFWDELITPEQLLPSP
jgi:hypothetical protein